MSNPASRNDAGVVVLGAGIVGLACAFRLVASGHRVTLVDRQSPGRGCSYGNAGLIATHAIEPLSNPATLRAAPRYLLSAAGPLRIHPRYMLAAMPWLTRFVLAARHHRAGSAALGALQRHSLDAFTRLLEDCAATRLLKARGHLLVAETDAAFAAFDAKQKSLAASGVHCKVLPAREVRQLAPGLTPALKGALYFTDTAHVTDPYRTCVAIEKAFSEAGGTCVRADIAQVVPASDGGFRLHAGDRSFDANTLVVAAGAWSRSLAKQLGERVPLDTERGYHVTAREHGMDLRIPVASAERHTVMTPMSEGLRITGFLELGGLHLPPRPENVETLQKHLQALLPGVTLGGTSDWMGHRPSLPDHLPVIGRARRHPRAFFAFGHQHLGLTLAGITADCIAALVEDREPPVDLHPFSLQRFS